MSISKLTVSSGCFPEPCLHVSIGDNVFYISILTECKCCPSPARVTLLYTCLDGFFCCILSKNKIFNTDSCLFFPPPFVWCCGVLKSDSLNPFCCILPDGLFFCFSSWSVCVVCNGTPPHPHPHHHHHHHHHSSCHLTI